jgi:hypothetical protein
VIAVNAAGQSAQSSETSFTIGAGGGDNRDGTWQGTTSQGLPISFTILNSRITSINFQYRIAGYAGVTPCTINSSINATGLTTSLTATGFNILPHFVAAGLSWQAATSSMTSTTATGNYLGVVSNSPQSCTGITGTLTFTANKS